METMDYDAKVKTLKRSSDKMSYLNGWLVALLILAFATSFTPAAQASSVFEATRGVNLVGFVASATKQTGAGAITEYLPYQPMCDPAFADQLVTSGVQFVRMVSNPLPLMQSDEPARLSAIDMLTSCGDRLVARGLAIIYDMHFWSPNNNERQKEALANEPQSDRFRDGLVLLARELAKRPQDRVALELLNEPPRCGEGEAIDWRPIQRRLVNEIRQVARKLPLVITGCGGSADGLLSLDNEPYFNDQKLIYTFHFYEPFIFTHQLGWSANTIDFLSYPPQRTNTEVLIKDALARLDTAAIPASQKAFIVNDLQKYLRNGYGPADIENRLRQIVAWGRQRGIPPQRILMGEFGAAIGFSPKTASTDIRRSEIQWIHDVRENAEQQKLMYAYWLFPRTGMYAYDAKNNFLKMEFLSALGLRSPQHLVRP